MRAAFDLLRDECASRFEEIGADLLRDPWKARDDFIEVIVNRAATHDGFLARHSRHKLDEEGRLRALTLLDMQRNAMLMYTSCGWFFNELSGIETVQTMKYAGHALDLMENLGLRTPRARFLEVLAQAKSNLPEMGSGADVFRRFVSASRVTPQRIAAHLAISRLANHRDREASIGDYHCREEEVRHEKNGRIALSTSRVILRNSISGRRDEFACAALHLGGVDFYCALGDLAEPEQVRAAIEKIWSKFPGAPLPTIIRIMQKEFGRDEFTLEDILPDGRLAICAMVFDDLVDDFTDQFTRLNQEYHRVGEMLQASGFEPPPQFRQLIEFSLGRRFEREIAKQQRSYDPLAYKHAIEIAQLIAKRGYQIDKTLANERFASMINEVVSKAVERPTRGSLNAALDILALSRRLGLQPDLEPSQECIYHALLAGTPHVGQLARLAGALGLAHSAVRRPKAHVASRQHDGHARPHPQEDTKGASGSRHHASRPRTS